MLTPLLITLHVEIIILGILDGLQWLNLPILFVAFAILFFYGAVRFSTPLSAFLHSFRAGPSNSWPAVDQLCRYEFAGKSR